MSATNGSRPSIILAILVPPVLRNQTSSEHMFCLYKKKLLTKLWGTDRKYCVLVSSQVPPRGRQLLCLQPAELQKAPRTHLIYIDQLWEQVFVIKTSSKTYRDRQGTVHCCLTRAMSIQLTKEINILLGKEENHFTFYIQDLIYNYEGGTPRNRRWDRRNNVEQQHTQCLV